MNLRKGLTIQRSYPDVLDKKMKLTGEITAIEGKRVSIPELDRRIMNIPNLKDILRQDACFKRGLRR